MSEMLAFAGVIGAVLYILYLTRSSNKKNLNAGVNRVLSMPEASGLPFHEYIRRFSDIVEAVAYSQSCHEGSSVYITVRKADSANCAIELCMRNGGLPFPASISFGPEFHVDGDYLTYRISGREFLSPEYVRDMTVSHMQSNGPVRIQLTESSIIRHGDYTDYPLVACSFSVYCAPNK